jgi:hypothetical protein
MIAFLICLLSILLLCQVLIAARAGGIYGFLLTLQAIYWIVAYVGRPTLLLAIQPSAVANDPIADIRLASQGYAYATGKLIPIIVFGQAIFLGLTLLLIRPWRGTRRTLDIHIPVGAVWLAWAALILVRFAYTIGVQSPWVSTGLWLSSIAIASGYRTGLSRASQMRYSLFVLFSEAIWSITYQSKTPIAAAVMTILLFGGLVPRKISLRHVVSATVMIPVAIFGFAAFQQFKQGPAVASALEAVDARYPHIVRPVLPIIRRVDLFSAVTDGYLVQGRWISVEGLGARAIESMIPRPVLTEKQYNAGEAWAREVRAYTVPSKWPVSLAEGPIAEGLAVKGIAGVAFETGFVAIMTYIVSLFVASRSSFLFSIGCTLALNVVLLERGLLGIFETAGKAVQMSAMFALMTVMFKAAMPTRVTARTVDEQPQIHA